MSTAAPASSGSTSVSSADTSAFKLFVGNLPFAFTDTELRTAFAPYKVVSANIIIGGQSKRSRGYGFVDLSSQADVENAVREMNSKEVGGRRLNVEAARFRPAQTGAGGSGSSSSSSSSYPAAGSTGGGPRSDSGPRSGGRFMPRRRFQQRGPRPGNDGGSPSSSSSSAPGSATTTTTTTTSPGLSGPGGSGSGGPRGPRRSSFPQRRFTRRPRSDAADKAARPPSTDTVFVSNLPFSTTDDGLRGIFHGLNIKEARVVRRYGRSRGYGFVAFTATADREAALKLSNSTV